MDNYIGFKLIQAEPAYKITYDYDMGGTETKVVTELELSTMDKPKSAQEGYRVVYSDGYESWSPKAVFESAYLKVQDNPKLPSGVSISAEMVDDFIVNYEVISKMNKITIVIATLRNGFTIVEHSSCVDPANYNEVLGTELCKEKIKKQVWNHLGFLLQTAWQGI